ncbi:MAG: A1 family peptidase [archaeon]|nr:A1 family peptidase [archaeon]
MSKDLFCFIFITILLTVLKSSKELNEDTKFNLTLNQSFYTVPVSFGTPLPEAPEQTFNLQIDTTTSETWVPSKKLKIPDSYDENASTTSDIINKTIEIEDEDGIVIGDSCYDVLKMNDGLIEVPNFGFVSVNKYAKNYKHYGFVKMLKINNYIKHERFYFDWETATLIIDGKEESIGNNNITYCNLTDTDDLQNVYRSGWVCELTHVFLYDNNKKSSVDGFDVDYGHSVDSRVIFDTAYPYISVPKKHFYDMFNKSHFNPLFGNSCHEVQVEENSSKEVFFECDYDEEKIKQFNFTIVLDGYGIQIKGENLFVKNSKGKLESLLHFIEGSDSDLWALGSPFMKSHSFIFDYEEKKVGIFKGEKIDLFDQWSLWMKGMSPLQIKRKIMYLIIGASIIGTILLIIIVWLIVRACRRKNSDEIEHGPLMNAEEIPHS